MLKNFFLKKIYNFKSGFIKNFIILNCLSFYFDNYFYDFMNINKFF